MLKPLLLMSLLIALSPLPAVAAAQLTELETRWLQAGQPVIAFARAQGLPLDIIVQPQDAPGAVPLALGFEAGRCKLVLSLRGNAQAQSVLQEALPAQQDLMIEAMTAHEIGHCRRYAQGDWHALPRGFVEPPSGQRGKLKRLDRELRDTRREEGYADLVALAWMHGQHREQYRDVLAWMRGVRAGGATAAGSHATQAWLALAEGEGVFDGAASPFEQAQVLWRMGLSGDK
ncbi:hypothetical protein GQ37_011325 [Janthinobacterium sp. BJB1]|uniref:hypothetical protein n=1 Tax=Janthinobacterium sp. GW458P TaxID=1981504 RepID=UPI000A323D3C|nr:hypothetical protein [Janthinobacterium sp. GW458P]MBE3023494.1 hypothetical protein [Janthinobacterium sp. GW458P]PHV18822.1 hypothetical protein CSQ90_03695 [Janthinobacterium sp. BJB303]PJC98276.1 hypothetical protein GQ37_011325 [Janthinobacterium sp. BJB1]